VSENSQLKTKKEEEGEAKRRIEKRILFIREVHSSSVSLKD